MTLVCAWGVRGVALSTSLSSLSSTTLSNGIHRYWELARCPLTGFQSSWWHGRHRNRCTRPVIPLRLFKNYFITPDRKDDATIRLTQNPYHLHGRRHLEPELFLNQSYASYHVVVAKFANRQRRYTTGTLHCRGVEAGVAAVRTGRLRS